MEGSAYLYFFELPSDLERIPKKYRKENPINNCVSHTLADIAKTMDVLGYNPEYSIEEGIR